MSKNNKKNLCDHYRMKNSERSIIEFKLYGKVRQHLAGVSQRSEVNWRSCSGGVD